MGNRNKKYSMRSLQKIIKKVAKTTGIKNWKEIHPHTLRHNFATHLVDNGYCVNEIQSALEHKNPETSMIYIHSNTKNLIKLQSPLGTL